MQRNPSEDDVDFDPQQGAAGLSQGDLDPGSGPAGTPADDEKEPVGRPAGQDEGYAGETGADVRSGGDIGGAAAGRS